jgi:hypothetical protein
MGALRTRPRSSSRADTGGTKASIANLRRQNAILWEEVRQMYAAVQLYREVAERLSAQRTVPEPVQRKLRASC